MKRLIFDLDDTICHTVDADYLNSIPNFDIIEKMKFYKDSGFEIIIFTSRGQRTHSGNTGKINAFTLPIIIDWLTKNGVPYNEIHTGKPWCGYEGFYVDDKAIRPDEFLRLNYTEICKLVGTAK